MPLVEIKDLQGILPENRRLLAIDHSPSAWGLALATLKPEIVTPLETLRGKNFTENIKTLKKICQEYDVGAFIVGLPYNMDNSEGARAQSVRTFVRNVLKEIDLPTAFIDERLTSFAAADETQNNPHLKGNKGRDKHDALAAAEILRMALKEFSR